MHSLSDLQARGLPQSLQALLADKEFAAELTEAAPRVQAKAESVLAGVKRRGAAMGDMGAMDAATERAMMDQILNEAFAREIVAVQECFPFVLPYAWLRISVQPPPQLLGLVAFG